MTAATVVAAAMVAAAETAASRAVRKLVAFLRTDGIYVMNANGTGQHRVLGAAGVRGLDW